jgi:hypothetical protein
MLFLADEYTEAISALAKNFPKVANFWKVDLRFMAILLEKCPKY